MSFCLNGIGVSRGIAIGKIHLVARNQLEVPEYFIPENRLEHEIQRYRNALHCARKQLQHVRDNLPLNSSADVASFIEPYLLMLNDSRFSQEPIELVKRQHCNAEWALKQQRDTLVSIFEEMEDPYLRSRKEDVEQIVHRLQTILLTPAEPEALGNPTTTRHSIVLADDLSPADTVLMQHQGIAAFLTEHGGATSHTAILARSLGIPAIVGVRRARRYIKHDDTVVVDSYNGVVLVDPDAHLLRYYRGRQREERRRLRDALSTLGAQPTVSLDGVPISLHVNIEFPDDIGPLKGMYVQGIGLYRTEFLHMNRLVPPDEEEHFQAYAQVVRALKGGLVTIRTLDLGADKQVDGGSSRPTANPALGLRAVRLCLKNLNLFRPQLRAILRASALGPVRLMIPMLSGLQELFQVRQLLSEARNELDTQGIPYDPAMPVGGMVEIPAIAVCADLFIPHVDFFSIGTNDLIQYTLAIDRGDDEVNYLYDPLHPAVLRLLKQVIQAADKAGKPVSMCGEMAGDSRYVRLLLGLGLRTFSVNPEAFLEVKRIINNTRISKLKRLVGPALKTGDSAEIRYWIERMNA